MSFLPDGRVFLEFASAAIILTLIPGPDMALFVGRAISQGKGAGLACIFGCITGIVIQVSAVSIGLSALIIASPIAFFILKVAGSLYLLWLAFQALCNRSNFFLERNKQKKSGFKRNYLAGLGINLLNPKVLLFNITFLPQFVDAGEPYALQKILILGLSFIPMSLPFTVSMVMAADRFAKAIKKNPLLVRLLDFLMAGIFTAFAVRLLMSKVKG
ncbi:LysE family translocator [uncultured Bartonella sp.]|uniref:LysE family translocator n=1 Tax=uncultured Bartonella sp. TaxID=104108 RepID=UPI002632BF59|nr:LysE family translocator [uncultured Bartonella sp.]